MGSSEVEKRILRSTAKLPSRMMKESLRLVPENVVKFNEIMQYPYLNEKNNKIRFNPFTGEIYISTYRHSSKSESQSQPPEGEIILMQRGRTPSQEIFQRWNQYSDVECAMRSAEHVLEHYGKEERGMVKNTLGAIDLTKRLLTKFESGEVSKENIEKIAQEALRELDVLGFSNAEKPIRQKLALQITKATGKDKLERVNPLISRTRLASAWLKAIRELLVAKKVREKFYAVAMDLLSERSSERFYLSQMATLMQDVLVNQNVIELKSKIDGLKEFSLLYLTPEKIKVAPYRKSALLSRYSLFGVKNESEKKLVITTSANEQEAVN
ncbi:MAG: hypothetical protein U1E54_02575, partial [Candidatus Levybacteria bacterium]|nr:hypothetical protein [Candidatus Levybacteria bacterium]